MSDPNTSEVPIGWRSWHLGNACTIATGDKDVNQGNPEGVFPFFTCAREPTFSDTFSFDGESILVAGNGEVGNAIYFDGGPFEVYQRVYVLQDFTTDAKYIFWYMKEHLKRRLERNKIGSVLNYIKLGDLKEFPVISPDDPAEQRRIAEILDTADEAIQKTEALIAKLKQMKAGLLHDLLTRGIDENGELRSGEATWEPRTLGDVCSLIKDGTHLPPKRVSHGPLLLSVQNMDNGRLIETDSDTRVPQSFFEQMHMTWQIEVGDVLLAVVGATLGKAARVTPLPLFTLQRSVAVLRGMEGVLCNDFLYMSVISQRFQNDLWKGVNQTAQPGIYLNEVAQKTLRLPSWDEQTRIGTVMKAHEDRIRKETLTQMKLQKLKAGLMHDLLTGKKRVNQPAVATA